MTSSLLHIDHLTFSCRLPPWQDPIVVLQVIFEKNPPLQMKDGWSEFILQSSRFARPYGPFLQAINKIVDLLNNKGNC